MISNPFVNDKTDKQTLDALREIDRLKKIEREMKKLADYYLSLSRRAIDQGVFTPQYRREILEAVSSNINDILNGYEHEEDK